VYPTDGSVIPEGTTRPVSPRRKYWAAFDYAFPEFTAGSFWTRVSYQWQSEVWDSISALTTDIDPVEPGIQKNPDLLLPEWKSGTFQFGFTSSSQKWDAALVVRNVFDDTSYNYLNSSDYSQTPVNACGCVDPRNRYVRSLQRPRSYYLSLTYRW
jgi:outer membrane receptor protein involved in Fe transport